MSPMQPLSPLNDLARPPGLWKDTEKDTQKRYIRIFAIVTMMFGSKAKETINKCH